MANDLSLERMASDIAAFAESAYWIQDNRGPLLLEGWQRDALRSAFPPEHGGDPAASEYLFALPKKTGKSAISGLVATWIAFRSPGAEVVISGPDLDSSRSRVFKSARWACEHSPLLQQVTKCYRDMIEFTHGAIIQAIALDWRGAAGGNYSAVIFDELHAFSESNTQYQRLWDELVASPVVPHSFRWVSSYAGYLDESLVLKGIWDRVLTAPKVQDWPPIYYDGDTWGLVAEGEEAHALLPWGRTERGRKWLESARRTERPLSFQRVFCNVWVESTGHFITPEQWDGLTDPEHVCPAPGSGARLVAGLDLGLSRDTTAVVSVFERDGRLYLGPYRIWTPPGRGVKLDIEATAERFIRDLARDYDLAAVLCDPWQAVNSIQRLQREGVNVIEFSQSGHGMVEAASALWDSVNQQRLSVYTAPDLRAHVLAAHAKETASGLRLTKDSKGTANDGAIALAMALHGHLASLAKPNEYCWVRGRAR